MQARRSCRWLPPENDRGGADQQPGREQTRACVHIIDENRAQPDQRVRKPGEHEENDQQRRYRRTKPGGRRPLIQIWRARGSTQQEIERERDQGERRQPLQPAIPQPFHGRCRDARPRRSAEPSRKAVVFDKEGAFLIGAS